MPAAQSCHVVYAWKTAHDHQSAQHTLSGLMLSVGAAERLDALNQHGIRMENTWFENMQHLHACDSIVPCCRCMLSMIIMPLMDVICVGVAERLDALNRHGTRMENTRLKQMHHFYAGGTGPPGNVDFTPRGTNLRRNSMPITRLYAPILSHAMT